MARRLEQLAALINSMRANSTLRFDPSQAQASTPARMSEPRPSDPVRRMARTLTGAPSRVAIQGIFGEQRARGDITANGRWGPVAPAAAPLQLELAELDRPCCRTHGLLLAADRPLPESLADIERLQIVEGQSRI